MKAKRAVEKEATIHSITHGKEPQRKLPKTLSLTRSQSLALVALHTDEQKLLKQVQDSNAAIEATRKARTDVLAEALLNKDWVDHGITPDDLNKYQFDTQNLILAAG